MEAARWKLVDGTSVLASVSPGADGESRVALTRLKLTEPSRAEPGRAGPSRAEPGLRAAAKDAMAEALGALA